MTHDKATVRLREAIQGEEVSLMTMNCDREMGADCVAEGVTGMLFPPYQVSQ